MRWTPRRANSIDNSVKLRRRRRHRVVVSAEATACLAGLVLYKATSQEQMAAAMVSLQQFERQHRSAAAARRKASEDSADDPDQAFRNMAMSEPENHLNRSAQSESSQRGLCVYTGFYKEEVGSLAQRGSGGKVSKELSQRRRGGGGVQVHTM